MAPQTGGTPKLYSRFDASSGPPKWKDHGPGPMSGFRRSDSWRNSETYGVDRWDNSVPTQGSGTPFADAQGNGFSRAPSGGFDRWDGVSGRGRGAFRASDRSYHQGESWKPRADGVQSWRSSSIPQDDHSTDWRGGSGRWNSGSMGLRNDSWRSGKEFMATESQSGLGHRHDSFGVDPRPKKAHSGRPEASPSSMFFRSFGTGVGVGGTIPWGSSRSERRYSTDQLARVYRHLLYSGRLQLPSDLEKDDPLLFLADGDFVDVVEQFASRDPASLTQVYIDTSIFSNRAGGHQKESLKESAASITDERLKPLPMAEQDLTNAVIQDSHLNCPLTIREVKQTLSPKIDPGWFYRDPQGVVQGPFSKQDIIEWFEGGFFPLDLLIRSAAEPLDAPFRPLAEILVLWRAEAEASMSNVRQEELMPQLQKFPIAIPAGVDQKSISTALTGNLLAESLQQMTVGDVGLQVGDVVELGQKQGSHLAAVLDSSAQIAQQQPVFDSLPQEQYASISQVVPQSLLREDIQTSGALNHQHIAQPDLNKILSNDPVLNPPTILPGRGSSAVLLHENVGLISASHDVQPHTVQPAEISALSSDTTQNAWNIGIEQGVPIKAAPRKADVSDQGDAAIHHQLNTKASEKDANLEEESNRTTVVTVTKEDVQPDSASIPAPPQPPETKPAPWIASTNRSESASFGSKSLLEIQKEEAEQREKEQKAAAAIAAKSYRVQSGWANVARGPNGPAPGFGKSLLDIQREEEEAKQDKEDEEKDDSLFWDYGDKGNDKGSGTNAPPTISSRILEPKIGGWAAAAAAGAAKHANENPNSLDNPAGPSKISSITVQPPPPPPPPRPATSEQPTVSDGHPTNLEESQNSLIESLGVGADSNNALSGQFRSWCADQMEQLTGNRDVTLCEFLMNVESNSEVAEYVATYFGNNPSASTFASEFLKRKLAEKASSFTSGKKSRKARAKANAAAAAGLGSSKTSSGPTSLNTSTNDDPSWASVSAGGKKSKKKGGNQKSDDSGLSSNTAFSVLMQ